MTDMNFTKEDLDEKFKSVNPRRNTALAKLISDCKEKDRIIDEQAAHIERCRFALKRLWAAYGAFEDEKELGAAMEEAFHIWDEETKSESLQAIIYKAKAEERERCAKIAAAYGGNPVGGYIIAREIRSMNNE